MTKGIGAASVMGIAFEVTPGTYLAPTKFFPFRSEGLAWTQETTFRRPIRGVPDVIGTVPGNGSFAGDIQIEALSDVVPYFIYASRATIVKTGVGPYTYVATPNNSATTAAGRTLSITIVRNGIVFGYTNCSVVREEYTIDGGLLIATYGIIGSDEASQSAPTPTWPTSVPFGAGQYSLEFPTATPVTDTDNFTLTIDNNGQQNYRLRNTGRGPAFASFGERAVTLSCDRDFESRAEYDNFKNLTAQSVTLKAVQDANNEIDFLIPVAIRDSYEVAVSSQGDLVRATTTYQGIYDGATSKSYQITVKTPENIT